jgi:hypothetical protein
MIPGQFFVIFPGYMALFSQFDRFQSAIRRFGCLNGIVEQIWALFAVINSTIKQNISFFGIIQQNPYCYSKKSAYN